MGAAGGRRSSSGTLKAGGGGVSKEEAEKLRKEVAMLEAQLEEVSEEVNRLQVGGRRNRRSLTGQQPLGPWPGL